MSLPYSRPSNHKNLSVIILSTLIFARSTFSLRRTFKTKTIVFFDTKVLAHRLNIVLGLAGIRAAEIHGNLAMTQRLEALDRCVLVRNLCYVRWMASFVQACCSSKGVGGMCVTCGDLLQMGIGIIP